VRLGVQVGGGLVGQQGTQLVGQFAEILGAERGIAHQAHLVLHQRVAHFDDLHGREGGKEREEAILPDWRVESQTGPGAA